MIRLRRPSKSPQFQLCVAIPSRSARLQFSLSPQPNPLVRDANGDSLGEVEPTYRWWRSEQKTSGHKKAWSEEFCVERARRGEGGFLGGGGKSARLENAMLIVNFSIHRQAGTDPRAADVRTVMLRVPSDGLLTFSPRRSQGRVRPCEGSIRVDRTASLVRLRVAYRR